MTSKPEKKENLLLNILLNIVIPTIILTKFSGEEHFGPTWGVVVALAFPIIYGIMDFQRSQKLNVFSALGVFSILLTGGISLLKLPPQYLAIKEAAIPAAIGLATLISVRTKYPLVKTFLYNDKIMRTDAIAETLTQNGKSAAFERTLIYATYMVATSFFVSSALNYILATVVVTGAPGTELYNEQLGKMIAYSYVVITIPSLAVLFAAMFYLFRQITKLTGMKLEDIFAEQG